MEKGGTMMKWLAVMILVMFVGLTDCIPEITEPPVNQAAYYTQSARFNCTAELGGTLLEWKQFLPHSGSFGDRIYISGKPDEIKVPGYEVVTDRGTETYDLIVKEVNQTFGGKFECNPIQGGVSKSAELVAMSTLVCDPAPGEKEVSEQVIQEMGCQVRHYGYKEPLMEWFDPYGKKYSEQVYEEDDGDDEIPPDRSLIRWVTNVTVTAEHDEMVFTCMMRFERNASDPEDTADPPTFTDQCSTYFYVLHSPRDLVIFPYPADNSTILDVSVGDVFNCSAKGRPVPGISWRSADRNDIHTGPYLIINENMAGDNQTYYCVADNVINGVPLIEEKSVSFTIGSGPQEGASTGGTEPWAIVLAIVIPVAVIGGVIIGVFVFFRLRNKPPSKGRPPRPISGGAAALPVMTNQGYEQPRDSKLQGMRPPPSSNVPPSPHLVPPVYNGADIPVPRGKDSPGYGDLGIKHMNPGYPGSTSSVDHDYATVHKMDPQGRASLTYDNKTYNNNTPT